MWLIIIFSFKNSSQVINSDRRASIWSCEERGLLSLWEQNLKEKVNNKNGSLLVTGFIAWFQIWISAVYVFINRQKTF